MEAINFQAGNEKRFADFVSKLDDKKVALISHTDLDGISAAKITNKAINADIIKFVDYTDLNLNLINELKNQKIETLILTDLSMNPEFIKEAEKHFKILIIDHHPFSQDYNSEKTVFMDAPSHCATYLSYYLFSKIQNLEKLDWLVALASIADWTYFKNQEFMSSVLEKHGDIFEITENSIRKSGKFWDLQWALNLSIIYNKDNLNKIFDSLSENFGEIKNLKEGVDQVQQEIDTAQQKFEKEKKEFKNGFFWEYNPNFRISSMLSSLISSKYQNKTLIVIHMGEKYIHVSARRQDKKENVSLLLKNLTKGFEDSDAGGHIPAAGGHFPKKYLSEFKERLKSL